MGFFFLHLLHKIILLFIWSLCKLDLSLLHQLNDKAMTTQPKEPMTPKQAKMLELLSVLKEEQVFSFEGALFYGNKVEAVKEYLRQCSSDKLYIWLSKHYTQLIPAN